MIVKIPIQPEHIDMQTVASKLYSVTSLIKGIDLTLARVTLISCANAINSN